MDKRRRRRVPLRTRGVSAQTLVLALLFVSAVGLWSPSASAAAATSSAVSMAPVVSPSAAREATMLPDAEPGPSTRPESTPEAFTPAPPPALGVAAQAPPAASSLPLSSDSWGYIPIRPARLLDTRVGSPTVDGKYSGVGAIGAGGYAHVPVAKRGGLPAVGDISAVVINLTGIAPSRATYLSVVPYGAQGDRSSTLNLSTGEVAANLAIVPIVGGEPRISVYNNVGRVDVAVDVVGFFRYAAVPDIFATAPARLLDTRPGGVTFDGRQTGAGAVPPGGTISVDLKRPDLAQLFARAPRPGDTVVLNVTGVAPTASTYLTVYPGGLPRPLASSVNVPAGKNVPNLVFTWIGDNGTVSIRNDSGFAHVVVDVVAYVHIGSNLQTFWLPARVSDTRAGAPTFDGAETGLGALGPNRTRSTPMEDRLHRVTLEGGTMTAAILNITGVAPTASTYLSAFATGTSRPRTSSLNLPAGAVRANATVVSFGSGSVSLYNAAGYTHVVQDAAGAVYDSGPIVRVRVKDAAGQLLPHAELELVSTAYPFSAERPWIERVLGNLDGVLAAQPAAPGAWTVCAVAEGKQKRCWTPTGPQAVGVPLAVWSRSRISLELVLPDIPDLTGTVTDGVGGVGLRNVEVQLLDESGNVLTAVSTASDGSFALLGTQAGRYRIRFLALSADGGSSTTGYASREWTEVDGSKVLVLSESRHLAVPLARGVAVTGVVSSAGLPVPGALVTVLSNAMIEPVDLSTDANGRYRARGVSPGVEASIWVNGTYLTSPHPYGYSEVIEGLAAAGPGQVVTKNITLQARGQVTGKIVDRLGAPLPGVKVSVSGNYVPVDTSTTGTFSVAPAGPGPVQVYFSYTPNGGSEIRECYDHVLWQTGQPCTDVTVPAGGTFKLPTVTLAVN